MMTKHGKRKIVSGKYLVLLALALSLISCLGWFLEEPTIVLKRIVVNPRSLTEMNLILGLEVHNPNRFDLTLKSFEYTVSLNGEEIGAGRLERMFRLPASSSAEVEVPVTATFRNPGGSLLSILRARELPYKIVGKARVETVLGGRDFTVLKEGRIDWKG